MTMPNKVNLICEKCGDIAQKDVLINDVMKSSARSRAVLEARQIIQQQPLLPADYYSHPVHKLIAPIDVQ
jgi:hypothetical protein